MSIIFWGFWLIAAGMVGYAIYKVMGMTMIGYMTAVIVLIAIAVVVKNHHRAHRHHWIFDRNELGPVGKYGQWYFDVYKCSGCPEVHKELVGSPRG